MYLDKRLVVSNVWGFIKRGIGSVFFQNNICLWICFLCIELCNAQQSPVKELRGVWVASVYNIDWPSTSELSTKEQKAEIIKLLDFYKSLNFNCVFVQVRPFADVFYPSEYEPWSRFLTGKQGDRPKPYYDPLKFWIKEAHKRGIEFHAWINPFRITNSDQEKLSKDHPALKNPDWVMSYGGKKLYNPALPQCRNHITNIIEEIVNNYEVDGIHFDDYFYPYPKSGESLNDSVYYKKYGKQFASIEDWRRNNVNLVVKQVYEAIKKINPKVKFGISPFGVWRNKSMDDRGSETKAGITNYDSLYADVLLWLKKGWIDYVTPQIYWSINNPAVPFNTLCDWWADHSFGKDVYVGMAAYKLDSSKPDWDSASKLTNQINIARANPNINGFVLFRHSYLENNILDVADTLRNYLCYPALIPRITGERNENIEIPYKLRWKKDKLKWKCKKSDTLGKQLFYAVYAIFKDGSLQLVYLSVKKQLDSSVLTLDMRNVYGFQISSVSKFNAESLASKVIKFR